MEERRSRRSPRGKGSRRCDKECYGQGARGLRRPRSPGGEETRELKLGVGGQGGLSGGDHGGGGHKGAE